MSRLRIRSRAAWITVVLAAVAGLARTKDVTVLPAVIAVLDDERDLDADAVVDRRHAGPPRKAWDRVVPAVG